MLIVEMIRMARTFLRQAISSEVWRSIRNARVRRLSTRSADTLEQIDVSMNLIEKYGETFAHCRTADEVVQAIAAGKVASIFGLEGWVNR